MRVVIEVPTSGPRLAVIRRLVVAWAESAGTEPDDLPLVVTELVTNAIQAAEAEGSVVLRLEDDPESVSVTVVDDGPGFELGAAAVPPPDAVRGRGLALVRAIVDSLEAERVEGHTVVTARKQRTVRPTAPSAAGHAAP